MKIKQMGTPASQAHPKSLAIQVADAQHGGRDGVQLPPTISVSTDSNWGITKSIRPIRMPNAAHSTTIGVIMRALDAGLQSLGLFLEVGDAGQNQVEHAGPASPAAIMFTNSRSKQRGYLAKASTASSRPRCRRRRTR